jgi:hypothetical protein
MYVSALCSESMDFSPEMSKQNVFKERRIKPFVYKFYHTHTNG